MGDDGPDEGEGPPVERATLTWEGGWSVTGDVRGMEVRSDKPEAKGGTDTGPMPTELYLVALAACTMTSTLRVAETRKVEVESLSADAALDFDDRGRVERARLTFHVESPADVREWGTIGRLAGRFCTLEQLTGPDIEKRYVVNGEEEVEVEKAI